MENNFVIVFNYVFTYIVIFRKMMILYFHLPYLHASYIALGPNNDKRFQIVNSSAFVMLCIASVNPSPSSTAYMHQWIRSALVHLMAWRLCGTKPLSKPMLDYCQLGPWEQSSVIFYPDINLFSHENASENCLRRGGHFVQGHISHDCAHAVFTDAFIVNTTALLSCRFCCDRSSSLESPECIASFSW